MADFISSLKQVARERSQPTGETISNCIKAMEGYPAYRESEDFSAFEKKEYIDWLTRFFCGILERFGDRDYGKVAEGYRRLIELNEKEQQELLKPDKDEAIVDFRHLGKGRDLYGKLAELYQQEQREDKAMVYREKERKAREKVNEGEALIRQVIGEQVAGNLGEEEAISRYKKILEDDPYNTKARVMLGFIYSLRIVADEVQGKESGGDYFSLRRGGIPLLEKEEDEDLIRINLGVNFQEDYYGIKEKDRYLCIDFICEKFGESNNQVFMYVRDFSDELKKLMAEYYLILKRSAFKFYREEEGESKEEKDKEERAMKTEENLRTPYGREIKGLRHFQKQGRIKVPTIARVIDDYEPPVLELELIEGSSMYDLFRKLETDDEKFKGEIDKEEIKKFKEEIEKALIDKHIGDLVAIQVQTYDIEEEMEGLKFETPDYRDKLEKAFKEKPDLKKRKAGGLTFLLKEHFGLEEDKVKYPEVLNDLGNKLNKLVEEKNKEKGLVIYKDSSPRNTKIDLRGVLEGLGIAGEFENKCGKGKYGQGEMVIEFLLREYWKSGSGKEEFLGRIADEFKNNLYQLDFEKINRLSSEFDDLIEIIEFPFFCPGETKEEKKIREENWEDKYKYFLRLKGKEHQAEELKEEYFLFSLNRNIRWLYYLMKWYNRPHQKESEKKQHLEDLKTHIGNIYWTIEKLNGPNYNFDEVGQVVEKIEQGIK
ncbi:hypothetical protein HZC30_03685 [Candidatus Woesearchaeota archaeon]|nr:hypothetical protein [Candidatus Woesearchaeota archaeon]